VEWSDGHTVEVPANSVRDSEGPAAIPAPSCQISPEARPPEPPPRPRAVKPRPKPVAPPALADEPERPVIQGSLGAEAELLAAALRHLQAGEIEAAMAAIDAHAARFPGGALAPEAARLREECLRARAR
jgi:TolA-binding protein